MIKQTIFLLVASFLLFIGNSQAQQSTPLVPIPKEYKELSGTFVLNSNTAVYAEDGIFEEQVFFLKERLLNFTGIAAQGKSSENSRIILKQGKKQKGGNPEAYVLQIDSDQVVISATEKSGIYNGISSLLQLAIFGKEGEQATLKAARIVDEPEYGWRGIMLDESRHFFGKEAVKEILDHMSLLKLNRFHWHLTDSQGWRLEIKKYPKLSLVGGIGNNSDSLATVQYYTQAEISEIVNYAAKRNIVVIPEIDMPGHATAANKAYPEYSGGGKGRFPHFTFNPGKEETYGFLTDILKEVGVLFPSGLIHLGGDEVSFSSENWDTNKEVLNLMKKHNLKGRIEVEQYFFQRMTDSTLQRFDKIMAWDEAVDADLPIDKTIIYWWRHDKPEQLEKALDKGFEVILSPRVPLYLDFVQDESHLLGRRWAKDFSSVEKLYGYSIAELPFEGKDFSLVKGFQANLWTEQVSSVRRLQYMLFPRIAALSEASWTPVKNRDYPVFLDRLQEHLKFYEERNVYYFNPLKPEETPEIIDLNTNE